MRKMAWFLALLSCTSVALAQSLKCVDVAIFESRLPIYPPIARAAHMQGIFRFTVAVEPDGHSGVRFLDGPSKGAFQILVESGRQFIESRRYGWAAGGEHQACSYTAEVEYRMLPEEAESPNNLMLVTDIDLGHTLVEVKATRPTVNFNVNQYQHNFRTSGRILLNRQSSKVIQKTQQKRATMIGCPQ